MHMGALRILILPTFMVHATVGLAREDPCISFYEDNIIPNQGFGTDWVLSALYNQGTNGCILGKADDSGILPLYLPLFESETEDKKVPPGERSRLRHRLFERVLEDLNSADAGACRQDHAAACDIEAQTLAVESVAIMLTESGVDVTAPLIQADSWAVDPDSGLVSASGVELRLLLRNACSEFASPECRRAVGVSARIIRSSRAMIQVIAAYKLPIIAQDAEFLSTRDREWNSYFNTISVQYPWELAFNSWRYAKATTRQERALFPQAPSSKWIILHPAPAFEYIDTPLDGNRLEASIVVEVAGYEWWEWEKGKAKNRWGVSGAFSYADVKETNDIGYGIVLHTPVKNTSLGVVMRDGDDGWKAGVIVNVDLAAFIMKYSTSDLMSFLRLQPD